VGGLLNLAGLEAAGADVDPLRGRADDGADPLRHLAGKSTPTDEDARGVVVILRVKMSDPA